MYFWLLLQIYRATYDWFCGPESQMNNCSFSESKPYTMISLVLLFKESVLWLIFLVKQNLCSLIFKQIYFIIQVLLVNQNHRAQPVKFDSWTDDSYDSVLLLYYIKTIKWIKCSQILERMTLIIQFFFSESKLFSTTSIIQFLNDDSYDSVVIRETNHSTNNVVGFPNEWLL